MTRSHTRDLPRVTQSVGPQTARWGGQQETAFMGGGLWELFIFVEGSLRVVKFF